MRWAARCACGALLSALVGPSYAAGQEAIERWSLVEELRIGAVDGPQAITEPSALVVSRDGKQLYVGQPADHAIRVFDAATGRRLRTIGRGGRGPGEFTWIGGMGWKQDTLYVTDPQAQSVVMFSPDGRHLRSIRVVSEPIPGRGSIAFPISMCADGTVVGTTFSYQGITSLPTIAMTRDGRVLRILADPDVRDSWFRIGDSNRAIVGVRPMGIATEVAVASDGWLRRNRGPAAKRRRGGEVRGHPSGRAAWGAIHDDLDVPYVVRYRVQRAPPR